MQTACEGSDTVLEADQPRAAACDSAADPVVSDHEAELVAIIGKQGSDIPACFATLVRASATT